MSHNIFNMYNKLVEIIKTTEMDLPSLLSSIVYFSKKSDNTRRTKSNTKTVQLNEFEKIVFDSLLTFIENRIKMNR